MPTLDPNCPTPPVEQREQEGSDDDPRIDWSQGDWLAETKRLEAALQAASEEATLWKTRLNAEQERLRQALADTRQAASEREEELRKAAAILTMEREWLLGAWAAASGIGQAEAEAEFLTRSAKWRETALAPSHPEEGE